MSHIWKDEEITSFKLLLRKITNKFDSEEEVKEAKLVAQLLTEVNAEDPEAWYFLGALNGILGEFNEAQKNLLQSLELEGNKFWNYVELANVL